MSMNYETLLVTKESGITTIAFNRPEKRNAMSPQLHGEMFDLLTDDAITSGFPLAERKAIKEFVPWTRLVQANKTTYNGKSINLPDLFLTMP